MVAVEIFAGGLLGVCRFFFSRERQSLGRERWQGSGSTNDEIGRRFGSSSIIMTE